MDTIQEQLKTLKFSERCKQILLGGLLGDSCLGLQEGYKYARYQFRHSIDQEEYAVWKFKKLQEIAPPKLQYMAPDGASKKRKVNFMGKSCKEMEVIQKIVCPNNKVEINPSNKGWLYYLDEFALLVWWLDDGSLVNNGVRGVFCTDGFNYATIEILQEYFLKRWDIKTTIGKVNRKNTPGHSIQYTKDQYYRLYLANTQLKKLFRLIVPKMGPPSMLYKFILRYNDPKFLESWISTLKEMAPQFTAEIEELAVVQRERIQKRLADK